MHLRSIYKWIMDSEATNHVTLHKMTFDIYEVISPCNMRMSDDSMTEAIRMGSFVIGVETRGKMTRICITNVLHVPKLQVNLLSASKFLSNGFKVQLHVNDCIVGGENGNVVAIAQHEGNKYQMTFTEVCGADAANFMRSCAGGDPMEI